MHRIDSGGKLSVHADYNKHPRHDLYRRINLLLYLNKNWSESWGGDLQIWNSDMTKMAKSILPIFNRAIIFNTTPTAYHGHPHPLNTPEGISRYSIAMYYFTKDRPDNEKDNSIAATWKEIPQ
jgi:Rps23 Pro-64 3,4-dihydroxylase Tpa1-like proline 4-hydroxylase